MKKAALLFLAMIVTGLIAYQIYWVNFLLLLIVLIGIFFLITYGLYRLFRPVKNRRYFLVPVWVILICCFGIVVSFLKPYPDAIQNSGDISQDLAYAYRIDQQDRENLKSYVLQGKLYKRDSLRLSQVKEIYQKGKIITPMDKFHAAFVFHHSDNSKDYEIAAKMAEEAAAEKELADNYLVQWLAKASYDRWMVSLGKPEKYNTQDSFSLEIDTGN